ncbi:hypothetical protein PIB30_054204 [Stylosanthes scabra]|uniref:C2 domain-containing protein n=1 Tax=Stylosanthes scabra TaxID=79078 RepID=A0ABU6RJD4_9FABA|nr:hypothetical protein [Stylosanthes scabra]
MSTVAAPSQLLEINVISAQDLAPVSKSMRPYAVAWLNPERRLATQVDEVGHTNPTWDEKFVYRVDEEFLNSENSVIMIEIYNNGWLRDVLIGTVGVLVSNLIPPSARSGNRKPKLRFVALQIRRPSGRLQGILNIGVTLVDSTMRSMPMYSELSTSAVGYWDVMNPNKMAKHQNDDAESEDYYYGANDSKFLTLQRCQSEKNDSTINDYTYQGAGQNFYVHDGNDDSEIFDLQKGTPIVNLNGSLCSDIGPSPSVVAAAIAQGLYPMPALPPRSAESSAVDGWAGDRGTEEGMRTKMERWKTELTPVYDRNYRQQSSPSEVSDESEMKYKTPKRVGKTPGRRSISGGSHRQQGKGLFSCFGTVFGCEISISCGGGNRKKRSQSGKARLITSGSELTYAESSQCI